MRKIKNVAWSILNKIGLGSHLVLSLNSALKDYGWFRSYRIGQSVDGKGNPIPWYTYPFLEFLKARVRSDFDVFEYGSGNSTRWYASRVSSIHAVEHDEEWYKLVAEMLPQNARVDYRTRGEEYIKAVGEKAQKYHIIIVDGRDRVKCALHAVDYLTGDGVLILDNSEREWYQKAKDGLAQKGFRRLDFKGMVPIVAIETTTSVFYRSENCLGI